MLSLSANFLSKRSSSRSFLSKKIIKCADRWRAEMSSKTDVTEGVSLSEVVRRLDENAPLSIAESWDNVGLLLEPSSPHIVKHLFLTNDLTESVLDEALEKGANMVLSYHPPIFSSVKRITQDKWKDRLIVKCLEHRIAIYSPHTSYDSVKGVALKFLFLVFLSEQQTCCRA